MVTLILAVTFGFVCFAAVHFGADAGTGWGVFWGVLGFLAFQAVGGILIQKRVKAEMDRVQGILAAGQKRLQAKMQRWQFRPPSSMQVAKKEIDADTRIFVKEALEQTRTLEKFRLWVPLMERQIATARVQLSWMIKDFKTVDALMPKVLLVDPTMAAIKMARMQMTDAALDEIRKVYRKAVRRVRYNQNVLLAATMSWIEVARDDADGAFKTLTEALKSSDNATLKRNHTFLMNNQVAHFSNTGIGDPWFALLLEEPRMRRPRQHMNYR